MARRTPPPVPHGGLPGLPIGVAKLILDLWRWIVDSHSGDPFAHAVTHRPDTGSDPVATAAPSHPTGAAASAGTAGTLLRSDAIIKQGIVTAKGQLVGHDASAPTAVPEPSVDGQVLTSDAAEPTGLKWEAGGGGAWTDDGATVRLNDETDDVHIGAATAPDAKLKVSAEALSQVALKLQHQTAPVDPSSISGLQFWLKADAIAGLGDGDPVAQWDDSSGNGRHATQGTGGFQPTYQTAEINGEPVVRFDGSDDFLATAAAISTMITAGAYTAFAVIKPAAISSNDPDSYQNDAVFMDAGGFFGLTLKSAPAAYVFNWDGDDDNASVAIVLGDAVILMTRHESGNIFIGKDGGAEASAASGNTATLTNVLRIARNYQSEYFQGDIAEILIYNTALSAADRNDVLYYLSQKYGIAATVDTEPTSDYQTALTPGGVAVAGISKNAEVYGNGLRPALVAKTADYTLTLNDSTVTVDTTGGNVTITLPSAVGIKGRIFIVKRISGGANSLTVDADGTETIDGVATLPIASQWAVARIQSDGANWITI